MKLAAQQGGRVVELADSSEESIVNITKVIPVMVSRFDGARWQDDTDGA